MKKIPDIINRLWNICGQMEVGTLLTCGSGIKQNIIVNQQIKVNKRRQEESQQIRM